MPFRFRKSIKIAKGLKINLSKSGISTTIGGRGASVNISKRGTRTTVGLPGTGLSYSSTSSMPGSTTPKAPAPGQANTSNQGTGCLAGVFGFLLLPFRVLADMMKSILNPQTRRSMLILVGVLLGACFACFSAATLVEGTGSLHTPAPTLDVNAIATDAMIKVWSSYTQTAAVIPNTGPTNTLPPASKAVTDAEAFTNTPANTSTLPPTQTPTLTFTASATDTPRPTFTLQPRNTATIVPSSGGETGNCDPSYPGVCIPPRPPDLDCPQVPYTNFTVLPPDPHGFDRDGDGIGCEG
jgi:hypothetical protein